MVHGTGEWRIFRRTTLPVQDKHLIDFPHTGAVQDELP